jgi:hypothetical protein
MAIISSERPPFHLRPVSPLPPPNRACDFHRTRLSRDRRLPDCAVIGCSFIEAAHFTSNTKDSQGDLRLLVGRTSIPWRPSPCRRLSRPPSTMTPPTPTRFLGGLLPSTYGPPTFTTMYSTDAFRWELMTDPSRSSRNPDRSAGISGLPLISFGLEASSIQPRSSFGTRSTIRRGRCPIVQGIEAGEGFPVGLLFLCLLTMCILSQAGRLGGLHRASPVPFRGSFFTVGLHPPPLRPNGSSPACTGEGVFLPLHHCASWRTLALLPLLPHTALHAGRDADRAPGCRDGPAP